MHRTLFLSVFLLGALAASPAPAQAAGIDTTTYTPLKEVGLEAARARADMEVVLLNISASQARLKRANEAAEEAARLHGMDSNDYALAIAYMNEIKRDTLTNTLDELERAEQRLARAGDRTGQQVEAMLGSKPGFRALAKAHLSDQRTPAVTALLLHLAIRKLHGRCQDLMSRALIGQLEGDLGDIEGVLNMIAQLDAGASNGGSGTSIDDLWDELVTGSGTSLDSGAAIDDFDSLTLP